MIRRVVSCSLCLLLLFLQLLFACFISLAFCLIAVYHTIPGTTSETPSVRLRVPQRSLLLTFRYHYFCARRRRGCMMYVSTVVLKWFLWWCHIISVGPVIPFQRLPSIDIITLHQHLTFRHYHYLLLICTAVRTAQ